MMPPRMVPWLLALSFAAAPAGVQAQVRLVAAGGELKAPGESMRLSCQGYGFNFNDYHLFWYRQAPGARLEWVATISHDSTYIRYGTAVEGRATASRNNLQAVASLALHGLHPQDSAYYFCAIQGVNFGKLTFGQGTRIAVMPNVTPSPSVYRLTSKHDEGLEMCLITDYSPEKLTSTMTEGKTDAVVEMVTSENKQEASYLSTYWAKKNEMQCGAKHEGFGDLEGKDPESGASTICVTGVSQHFRTDEKLNLLSFSQLGLKIILMKGIIFNVLITMLMWKKKNESN